MYLKQIITRNIQSHREVVIDLPATGLVVFTGQNSNGKSVITKTLRYWLSGQVRKPRIRASLVHRQAAYGEIIFTRSDDVVLTMHVAREANLTYVKLEIPEQDPIVRYLADKSYEELIRKFGWHYDSECGISLNIAEAEEALLFYKTPYKDNAHLLETATSDSSANAAAESLEVLVKDARHYRDEFVSQANAINSALHDLKVEEAQPLCDMRSKLAYYYNVLSKIYIPNIPEIKGVPNIQFANVQEPKLPEIHYPTILDVSCSIPDILPLAAEIKTLKEHRCPTCGRGF